MNIREFSHNLQKIYDEMSVAFNDYQASTELLCLSECGKCCLNPEIEASPLEMIPMALKIYEARKLEDWYQRLEGTEKLSCLMFNGKNCVSYNERPSVCRMFGVAGYFNKKHEITLSICKFIKEERPELSKLALENINDQAPVIIQWATRLQGLDPKLSANLLPINAALMIALEKVALWHQYREDEA